MAIKYLEYVKKLAVMGAVLFPTQDAVDAKILKELKKAITALKNKEDDDCIFRLN